GRRWRKCQSRGVPSRWRDLRGMEIVSFGVSSVKANEEDEQMIKELQRNADFPFAMEEIRRYDSKSNGLWCKCRFYRHSFFRA
ncbi:hypothetical protein, partial [Barnesiella intestinihominis]|uniref:hypothetical protein n=1 Tax=Barnesiella intestinihominis TaxID=487174 RepID=UPI003AB115BD